MENPGQDLHSDEQSADHAAKPKPKFMAAEAAAKVGIGKSQSLFTLVLVSFIASLMIAFYVLGVGMFMLHKKQTDTVADAAFEAAHELADISVEHPSTGTLNLCRWRDQGTLFFDSSTDRSRSFESVKRTYDKLQKLAQLTNIAILQDLVGKDRTILGRVEKELRERLDEAIAPELTPHIAASAAAKVEDESLSRGRIYRAVANLIGGRYGLLDKSGLDLKIQLGYIKDPARHGDAQMFMIKPELFQPAPENQAPNLVLLSYIEPSKHDSGTSVIKKEASACICINPAYESPAAAALVLNFPQGVPPFALRMADYLKQSSWNNKGIWHQAVDGEVPGAGHLAPPLQPLLPEMSPADALATEMYHWLRYAGDRIDPDTIVAMLQETWSTEPTQVDADHSDEHSFGMMDTQINSCIINDSGSREHALMFEGKEGEAGQSALARAFLLNDSYRSSTPMKPPIPDDAFPLCVDSSGKCTMVGQNRFDEKLIRDFLADLQATNLAARETLSTVKPMQQMSVQVVAQLEQKLRVGGALSRFRDGFEHQRNESWGQALLHQSLQILVDGGSLRADDLGERMAGNTHRKGAIAKRRGEGAKCGEGQVV